LVEMLIDRGATHVVSFDVLPRPTKWIDPKYDEHITYVQGDLVNKQAVLDAFKVGGTALFLSPRTRIPHAPARVRPLVSPGLH
jgi:hypothetical protein